MVVIAVEENVKSNVHAKRFINEGSIDVTISAEAAALKVGSNTKITLTPKTLSVEHSEFLLGKIKCGS